MADGQVDDIAPWGSPEVGDTFFVGGFCLGCGGGVVVAVPGDGSEEVVGPDGFDGGAAPFGGVVEHEDEAVLVASAGALHDIEIVIDVENMGGPACIGLMGFYQRVDAVGSAGAGKVPVIIVLPEDAGIAFVGEDKSIRQHFVVDDRVVADNIVVFDKGDGQSWVIRKDGVVGTGRDGPDDGAGGLRSGDDGLPGGNDFSGMCLAVNKMRLAVDDCD